MPGKNQRVRDEITAKLAKVHDGECSWGSRMPWLPIRQDPRLAHHLLRRNEDERSPQCRYASLQTLASTNSSLRELVLGSSSSTPGGRPTYSLLDLSTKVIRHQLLTRIFASWINAVAEAKAAAEADSEGSPSTQRSSGRQAEIEMEAGDRDSASELSALNSNVVESTGCFDTFTTAPSPGSSLGRAPCQSPAPPPNPAGRALAEIPRFYRSGPGGQRYGVLRELRSVLPSLFGTTSELTRCACNSRGALGTADTRIEAAVDCSDAASDSPEGAIVLKVYKQPAAAPMDCIGSEEASVDKDAAAAQAERERDALSRCTHDHVLRLLDSFKEQGGAPCAAETLNPNIAEAGLSGPDNYILVLEHAPGGSLDEYLSAVAARARHEAGSPAIVVATGHAEAAGPKLAGGAALDLCNQLIMSVAHCHSMSVAHRDIKPANCLLFADKTRPSGWLLKLGDFGLASIGALPGAPKASAVPSAKEGCSLDIEARGSQAAAHSFDIGTEPYQSPEVCGLIYTKGGGAHAPSCRPSEGYDPFQSDLWSLCCTVYEICALQQACRCAPDAVLGDSITYTQVLTGTQALQPLKQATVPPLPPPPLFAEEFEQLSSVAGDATCADAAVDGWKCSMLRKVLGQAMFSWSLPEPALRLPLRELLRDPEWNSLLEAFQLTGVSEPPAATKQVEEEAPSSASSQPQPAATDAQTSLAPADAVAIGFGGVFYALCPLTTAAADIATPASSEAAQRFQEFQHLSTSTIASMESDLRSVYSAPELAELELLLLSAMIRHQKQLMIYATESAAGKAAAEGGTSADLRGLEDKLVRPHVLSHVQKTPKCNDTDSFLLV